MSREQRRMDRRQQQRAAAARRRTGAPPARTRRTPQRVGGGGPNWTLLGVAAGAFLVVLLIGYLLYQATRDEGASGAERAQLDDDPGLPGQYFPPQGRSHFRWNAGQAPVPFCDGVARSAEADARSAPTPGGTAVLTATPTPVPATSEPTTAGTSEADATGEAVATPTVRSNCYTSNPPSSGNHIGVQRQTDVGGGVIVDLPPNPFVFPRDVELPRDAIPHILEHAGVFVGYHCVEGDDACLDTVDELEDIVNDRIDNHDDRVVMAPDSDLPDGEIGMSSWTRADHFPYTEFDRDRVIDFIGTHSCRYDPEGFCR